MYFATIDCGTTNSRVYIMNENMEVVNRGEKKVGVKDTAITGSNKVLKNGLRDIFIKTISDVGITKDQIKFAITSGMITSEIGLIEIPHLWAPAGIKELSDSIEVINDTEVFPVDIPMVFIRGIKNHFPENTTYRDIQKIDFMRGEETQVAGLLAQYDDMALPLNLVILSSHTKFIHINKQKKICGSLTTLSGQTYEAIKKETFIGKSIKSSGCEDKDHYYFNEEVIDTAFNSVIKSGFIRTLLMPRFMEVLLETTWYERKLFTETAIVAEDLKALKEFRNQQSSEGGFVLVGHKIRCQIMAYLLNKFFNIKTVKTIYNKEDIDRLSIEGAVMIARESGLF